MGKTVRGPAEAHRRIHQGKTINQRKDILVQIFLPRTFSDGFGKELRKLKKIFMKEFGGVSSYEKYPITSCWSYNGGTKSDDIILIKGMTAKFDDKFWKSIKAGLERRLNEREILIRWMQASTLKID